MIVGIIVGIIAVFLIAGKLSKKSFATNNDKNE